MLVIRTLLASDCYESDNRALSFDSYASKRAFLLLMVIPVISALLDLIFTPVKRALLALTVMLVISALLV